MLSATRRHSRLTFSLASRDWSFIMNERSTRLISRICDTSRNSWKPVMNRMCHIIYCLSVMSAIFIALYHFNHQRLTLTYIPVYATLFVKKTAHKWIQNKLIINEQNSHTGNWQSAANISNLATDRRTTHWLHHRLGGSPNLLYKPMA